jgi:hypothetical protein
MHQLLYEVMIIMRSDLSANEGLRKPDIALQLLKQELPHFCLKYGKDGTVTGLLAIDCVI